MIRVRTPSRLHFGMLSLPAAAFWPDRKGEPRLPARRYGGVGLMVDAPGIDLRLWPSNEWTATGSLADRVLVCAQTVAKFCPQVKEHHIELQSGAPLHAGLGTGTQLALAIAAGLLRSSGVEWQSESDLARAAGRGARSALGVHGFLQGGFLVEGGKVTEEELSPLVARLEFPEEWRIVLVIPPWTSGLHGKEEVAAFRDVMDLPVETTDSLCRLVLLGMLPSLIERDLQAFGEAVYDFNWRVGEAFARVQGGPHGDPRTTSLIATIRDSGVSCVGQSSWGPAVFAGVPDAARANNLVASLKDRLGLEDSRIFVTRANNRGAALDYTPMTL
jgi:beta-RFAP synthase